MSKPRTKNQQPRTNNIKNTRNLNRSENIQRLRQETFDLCIIGGGVSGAGCALDAALRGLKVALVEKNDFAAGTSSKSTKLIHGGVRYLEQAFKYLDFAQLRQVRHGLEERHILLQNAPHLARPLSIVTPVDTWWESLYYGIGLTMYDWFASGKDDLPKSRRLSKAETLRRIPGLSEKIYGAVQYYDGQLDLDALCKHLKLDVFNFANFLNKDWGQVNTAAFGSQTLLTYGTKTTGNLNAGAIPIFQFDPNFQKWNAQNIRSNYQVQAQLRYSF